MTLRKLFVILAAIMMPFALLASGSGAAAPAIDVTNDHVTCNTINQGLIKISPAITSSGSSSHAKFLFSGKLGGCVDEDNSGVTFSESKSSFKGTINVDSNTCISFFSSIEDGTFTVKWIADQKITPSSSTITLDVDSLTAGTYTAPWGAQYATFAIGDTDFAEGPPHTPVTVTGAFTGGDGGATSTFKLISQEWFDSIQQACFFGGALKVINFGIGQVHLG